MWINLNLIPSWLFCQFALLGEGIDKIDGVMVISDPKQPACSCGILTIGTSGKVNVCAEGKKS